MRDALHVRKETIAVMQWDQLCRDICVWLVLVYIHSSDSSNTALPHVEYALRLIIDILLTIMPTGTQNWLSRWLEAHSQSVNARGTWCMFILRIYSLLSLVIFNASSIKKMNSLIIHSRKVWRRIRLNICPYNV